MGGTRRGVRIEVLGPLRVLEGTEAELERASHRRLLSILALEPNHVVETEELIDRYWSGDPPATAKATLQMHVSSLRRVLPSGLVVTEGRGYRLDLATATLDVHEFTARADEAHRLAIGDMTSALIAADTGLALWRGKPFAALRADDFAQPEIARLEELHALLLELRAEALLALGRERDALPELERLVVEHPLRERLWEHLMTARHRAGRHAEALEAYREAYAALAEIGLEPGARLRELERKILVHDERLAGGTRHNLPVELTEFVGREAEVEEVGRLLGEHRLVTLTGVGGAGKTRLALQAAAISLEAYPDGCWLVELAPLRDPELVAAELASALGLQPGAADASQVASAVARDTTLILLDNCEHVLGAAATLAQALVEAGPGVTVLTTSREPLHVQGEVVYDVPPMSFLRDGPVSSASLRAFDSVRLFEERAALARPSFELDRVNADAVARICRRLDGIPLAIELAAGRVGALSPESIADHLDDRFRLLTGGPSTGPERHRTLGAALDWSYELLGSREKALFARLGVFEGGFDVAAAAAVCADDAEQVSVPAVLSNLVEKSLVSRYEAEAARRHRLLETLRHYALERLVESGDVDRTRTRHMRWYVHIALDASTRVHGPGRWTLHERLDDEIANLQTALDWALESGHHLEAAELARALAWNGFDRRRLRPCIGPLRAALAESVALPTETEMECRALLGTALFLAGDETASYAEYGRVASLADRLEPSALKVWSLTACARVQLLAVDLDPRAALPFCRRALTDAEASGDPFALVYARRALGRALVWNGDADEGLEQHDAALGVALATGDPATMLETYRSFFDLLYLHPVARRSEPKRLADEMLARFPPDDPRWSHRVSAEDWLRYVFCQSGEWERADALLDLLSSRHLEGWDRVGYLVTLCTLRWMQGRLDDAHADLAELQAHGVPPGWFHAYYPLLAEIAADEGRLGDLRGIAAAYLVVDTVAAEESKKVAVLTPLVRAEIDAALVSDDSARADHIRRATAALHRSREILTAFPPPTGGSIQMETPATQLALAEAELSRAVGPDPTLWEAAVTRADYVYFRLYARWRLGESLLAVGRVDEAEAELRTAHRDASAIGADGLRERLEETAVRAGLQRPDFVKASASRAAHDVAS